ncbi:hypothetical protein HDU79_001752 [Rhizoclosmatium sp. JEL0117]|nr:hypothetical protein HDU79_001752 [Rhizoclosmatium sp. JEL0117]
MVVKLRLARWGVRHNPFYGVVVANARAPRDGRHLERVGTYNPVPDVDKVKHVELNYDRIKYWLGVGAQPTDRVAWILAKAGLMPLTPIQQQRTGHVSLTDRKTWKVKIVDSAGTERVVAQDEARRLTAAGSPAHKFLENVAKGTVAPPAKLLSRETVDISKAPKAPLSASERLLVLREMLGVY